MIFGKIDYLNLLPFYIYLQKRVPRLNFRKGVPSKINKYFHNRQVDFAFISSIHSRNNRCGNLGVIAKNDVLSVLVLEGARKKDSASETSNRLAELLNIDGEVIIGDRALKEFLHNRQGRDLAKEWVQTYNLPFVFAKLCYHTHYKFIRKLEKDFSKHRVFIPQYILKQSSQKVGITPQEIRYYLSKIDYQCNYLTKQGLKKFLSLDRFSI